jgi:hypothetical protein
MTRHEKYDMVKRIGQLPLVEQLELVEELLRNLRKANTDDAAIEKAMDAMVADPDMQRVLNNEDLVDHHAAG